MRVRDHDDPLYKMDNNSPYSLLDDTTRVIEKEKTKFLKTTLCGYVSSLPVIIRLSNEYPTVGYLLVNIVNPDPDLREALASIRANVNNMRDIFESAVAFMLPVCPYSKHSKKHNPNTAVISDVHLEKEAVRPELIFDGIQDRNTPK